VEERVREEGVKREPRPACSASAYTQMAPGGGRVEARRSPEGRAVYSFGTPCFS
jgi:hypothetical protein